MESTEISFRVHSLAPSILPSSLIKELKYSVSLDTGQFLDYCTADVTWEKTELSSNELTWISPSIVLIA